LIFLLVFWGHLMQLYSARMKDPGMCLSHVLGLWLLVKCGEFYSTS
jgi:hypothetical protein